MSTKASNYQPAQMLSIKAQEDLPTKRFVSPNGYLTGSGLIAIGVTELNWQKGNMASIISLGTAIVECFEAIAIGDKVSSAATGKAKKITNGDEVLGVALCAASSSGFVKIKLLC
jgi:hypothetical protein